MSMRIERGRCLVCRNSPPLRPICTACSGTGEAITVVKSDTEIEVYPSSMMSAIVARYPGVPIADTRALRSKTPPAKHAIVTGGAGFIGSHVVDSLLRDGWRVTALDNFDPYYDPSVKWENIAQHRTNDRFALAHCDIRDETALESKLSESYDILVHLAAKAGVRPSIQHPSEYLDVNVRGTQNLLELCRKRNIRHVVFASSSSVYGVNARVPWSEDDLGLLPISPYASSKISGELLGHVYSHLFGIRFTALRFFTAYGPRQRPDLAIHTFVRQILHGQPITMFGDGSTRRDYTYIGDVVRGVRAAMEYTDTPYEIFNLGNSRTVALSELIYEIEHILGVEADIRPAPEQPGDVTQTWANTDKADRLLGFRPDTPLVVGLGEFVAWANATDFGHRPRT